MRFLDRYVSDEGEALIAELRRVGTGGKSTKAALQFLCYGAAQALEVAKNQHATALIHDRLHEEWSNLEKTEAAERSIVEQQREIRELSEQRRNLRGGAS